MTAPTDARLAERVGFLEEALRRLADPTSSMTAEQWAAVYRTHFAVQLAAEAAA